MFPRPYPVLLAVFFFGFSAIAYEVLWTRFLGLVLLNTVTTYTLVLSTVLLGIFLGSLAAAPLFRKISSSSTRAFGLLQVWTGPLVLLTLSLPPVVWRWLDNSLTVHMVLLLPAAVLSGACFPLGVKMVTEDPCLAGIGVGRAAAVNTLGGILGSLLVGFVLLPRFGLSVCVLLITAVSLLIGLAALRLTADNRSYKYGLPLPAVMAVLLWCLLPWMGRARIPDDFLGDPMERVEVREGQLSHLAVLRRNGAVQLEIDRMWQGQNVVDHQILAAHIPMLIRPGARSVLVVGLGVGQTAGRFLMYDIRRLDCVEIEKALFDLIPKHFDSAWMKDPRVRLICEDGRNYIRHTEQRYDLISLEVGQALRPGVPAFYTVDFYRRVRARLLPGGMVSQFVPLLSLPPEAIPGILNSFLQVFPQALLWYNTSEVLLLGMDTDRIRIDVAGLESGIRQDPVRSDLGRYYHWGGAAYTTDRLEVFLSGFLCGAKGLSAMASEAPSFTDDLPRLDYMAAQAAGRYYTDAKVMDLLSRHVEDVDSLFDTKLPAELASAIHRNRRINLGQMLASALIQQIGREKLTWEDSSTQQKIEQAVHACPEYGDAARLMGESLVHRGQIEEGKKWLEKARILDPQNSETAYELGVVLWLQGKKEDAICQMKEALRLAPDDGKITQALQKMDPSPK